MDFLFQNDVAELVKNSGGTSQFIIASIMAIDLTRRCATLSSARHFYQLFPRYFPHCSQRKNA